MFEQTTDLASILPMAIADREEMTMLKAHDVGRCYVSVLVCLVWIMGCNSTFGREGKLCYNIADFLRFRPRFLRVVTSLPRSLTCRCLLSLLLLL